MLAISVTLYKLPHPFYGTLALQALHRRQILEKIEMETQRIRNLLDGKQQMLSKHIQANLNLVIHRQSMIEQMQELSVRSTFLYVYLEQLAEIIFCSSLAEGPRGNFGIQSIS